MSGQACGSINDMTHVRVTHYVEAWQGTSVMALNPGVFEYAFLKGMVGEEFLQERLADGTLVPLTLNEEP